MGTSLQAHYSGGLLLLLLLHHCFIVLSCCSFNANNLGYHARFYAPVCITYLCLCYLLVTSIVLLSAIDPLIGHPFLKCRSTSGHIVASPLFRWTSVVSGIISGISRGLRHEQGVYLSHDQGLFFVDVRVRVRTVY